MIQYTYTIDSIVNNAHVLSLFRSNSMIDKGEQPVIDDISLNPEDVSMIKRYLKAGSVLIAYALSGYSNNLIGEDNVTKLDPFEFDTEDEDKNKLIVFRSNMPSTWPESTKTLIDESIKDCLESYVLYRVSKHKFMECDSYLSDFESSIGNIRCFLSIRNDTVKRPYNLF